MLSEKNVNFFDALPAQTGHRVWLENRAVQLKRNARSMVREGGSLQ